MYVLMCVKPQVEGITRVPASAISPPAGKTRSRSLEARRAARAAKAERERLIVDCLNRGVAVAEIAARIGVTEKRMRALMREILARRAPAAPEEFAAAQVARLNAALAAAYAAMSPDNLRAVALVVRIVRDLDRYHGFVPAARRASLSRREAHAMAEPARERSDSSAEPTSQPVEKAQNAPGNGASCNGRRNLPAAAEGDAGSTRSSRAEAPDKFAASEIVRLEAAPQALDNARSAPGFGVSDASVFRALTAAAEDTQFFMRPSPSASVLHVAAAFQPFDPHALRRARVRALMSGVATR